MKTNRIISALRKAKAALELEAHVSHIQSAGYHDTDRYRSTLAAIQEADAVLADWQAEKLKKNEAFQ